MQGLKIKKQHNANVAYDATDMNIYLNMCMCLSMIMWCYVEDALSVIAMCVTAATSSHGMGYE